MFLILGIIDILLLLVEMVIKSLNIVYGLIGILFVEYIIVRKYYLKEKFSKIEVVIDALIFVALIVSGAFNLYAHFMLN